VTVSASKTATPSATPAPKAATKPAPKAATKPAVKVAVKAAAKPAAKPAAKAPVRVAVKAAKPAAPTVAKASVAASAAKPAKVKKPKMVRDSFTIPKAEYAVLDVLKLRAAKLSNPAKKTELIRAGIKALAGLSDAAFLTAVRAVPNLKTGRPAKD